MTLESGSSDPLVNTAPGDLTMTLLRLRWETKYKEHQGNVNGSHEMSGIQMTLTHGMSVPSDPWVIVLVELERLHQAVCPSGTVTIQNTFFLSRCVMMWRTRSELILCL